MAFKSFAEKKRDLLRELISKMKIQGLPSVEALEEFRSKVEAILAMPSDECVETFAKEGEKLQRGQSKG